MDKVRRYAVYLLVIAGCGGLLFDFGGTIIGPALPYIGPVDENPGSLGLFTTSQVAHLSSAVVMCAALASLAAGWLAEKFGRKLIMLASAAIAADYEAIARGETLLPAAEESAEDFTPHAFSDWASEGEED